jgi:hypothetical protein
MESFELVKRRGPRGSTPHFAFSRPTYREKAPEKGAGQAAKNGQRRAATSCGPDKPLLYRRREACCAARDRPEVKPGMKPGMKPGTKLGPKPGPKPRVKPEAAERPD